MPAGRGGGERESEKEREKERRRRVDEGRESSLASPFMFFPPPGPALCKLGFARSAVCST